MCHIMFHNKTQPFLLLQNAFRSCSVPSLSWQITPCCCFSREFESSRQIVWRSTHKKGRLLPLLLFRLVVAQVELEPPPETALAASASKTCAHRHVDRTLVCN